MVIKKVNLDIVVGVTSTLPETSFPEVAFAGKSNVGKSSLINALMNRKSYARTSSQPGKTQTINFYNINDSMYLVDLPGYGYANVSPAVKAKHQVHFFLLSVLFFPFSVYLHNTVVYKEFTYSLISCFVP